MEKNDSNRGRRMVRRPEGQVIGGVAAAIADYLGIDATIVRLAWVIAAFAFHFWAVAVAYIVALIIIPEERGSASDPVARDGQTITLEPEPGKETSYRPRERSNQGLFWVGILVTFFGLYLLAEQLIPGMSRYIDLAREVSFGALLILVGVFLIFRRKA